MLGVSGARLVDGADGVEPAVGAAGVKVVSMELLQSGEDAPLRWRGPGGHASVWQSAAETSALRELLSDVVWGELDFLLVDVPPGVDKIERLLELVTPDASLLVSTTSEMSRRVVARSARLVREAGLTGVALLLNMSEHICEECGHATPLYSNDGAHLLGEETGLPVWGNIPFDPALAASTDAGRPWVLEAPEAPASRALRHVADRLVDARDVASRSDDAIRIAENPA
jgi:ATP-binding protein involved in chromosome partitioning